MFAMILGTMTFARQVGQEEAGRILESFFASDGREIDTARVYGQGKTEEMLGHLLANYDRSTYRLATKANPSIEGNLGPDTIRRQLETSLDVLKLERADLFYLHQPDLATPIEKTLEGCARLHEEGKFVELGLSNYAAWQVADIWHICRKEGWVAPTVYQGIYNALTRAAEPELFPCLRSLGMRFYAYNPLAGGLLTGRYQQQSERPEAGRFAVFKNYLDRYWKPSLFQGLDGVRKSCDQGGISMASAALRWMAHHSGVDGSQGDGAILGVSRVSQLEENIAACRGQTLPDEVVSSIEAAWQAARLDSPKYFRP